MVAVHCTPALGGLARSSHGPAGVVLKVLLSWLRDFASFDAPVERMGHDLSMLGMAVEEEVHLGRGLDGIVVARVLELRQHPDAKKIQRVTVDAGAADPVEVWCGAFNMAVGDLVPLATVGTTMPNGMEIGRRKILGEYSNGMLCSPKELELSDEAGGILLLDRRRTGHTPQGGTRHRVRRALGPRDQPQPARCHVRRRCRPRPRGPLRAPVHAALAIGHPGRRRRHDLGSRRGARSRPLQPVHGLGDPRLRGDLARSGHRPPPDAAGDALHQRHRRRLELRDARVGAAQPPLRPRHVAGRRHQGAAGPPRRDPGHPRRGRAPLHRRRPAHLRRRRPAHRRRRDHGWCEHRDQRVDHRRARRDGTLRAAGDRQDLAAPGAPQRGVGPFREGDRPRGPRAGPRPLPRVAGRLGR